MHADQARGQLIAAAEAARAHQRDGDGGVDLIGKGFKFDVRAAAHHAAAADQQRLLGFVDHLDQAVDVAVIRLRRAEVLGGALHQLAQPAAGAVLAARQRRILREFGGDVLGNVQQHRAGAAAARDGERLADGVGQFIDAAHEVVALRDRHRHAGDVDLLKRVLAQQARADVAGDAHDGRGVHIGGGDAGDQVRRARAGRREADAHLARRARIAVRRVAGALFVRGQDVPDAAIVIVQFIVHIQDRAARISENRIDPLLDQALHQDFCAGHSHDVIPPSIFSQGLCAATPLAGAQSRIKSLPSKS